MGIIYKINPPNTSKWLTQFTPPSSLTSPLVANQLAESPSPSLATPPRPPRTSALSALERRATVSISRDAPSTESFQASWPRVAISLPITALVASPSTVVSSRTRTSSTSTLAEASCPWPTLDQAPTDPSSSSASTRPHISTVLTSSSARSPMALPFSISSSKTPSTETTSPRRLSSSLTAVKFLELKAPSTLSNVQVVSTS